MKESKHMANNTCGVDGCNSDVRSKFAGLCEKHYYRKRRHGDPLGSTNGCIDMTDKEKIEHYSEKITETGCWIWMGGISHKNNGYYYGTLGTDSAHRQSYIFYKGEIKDGLCVCHVCDTPLCVNPDHLFLGTQKDNIQDMMRKGRGRNNYGGYS